MNRSDFLKENYARLEIVFLDFAIQHPVNSLRISQVPTFTVSTCHALGHRKVQVDCLNLILPSLQYNHSALSHLNYLSVLYYLKVTFHLMACRLSAYTSHVSLPSMRKARYKALFISDYLGRT